MRACQPTGKFSPCGNRRGALSPPDSTALCHKKTPKRGTKPASAAAEKEVGHEAKGTTVTTITTTYTNNSAVDGRTTPQDGGEQHADKNVEARSANKSSEKPQCVAASDACVAPCEQQTGGNGEGGVDETERSVEIGRPED